MDPPENFDLAGDSTYALMCECTRRGYEVTWCLPGDLYALDGKAFAHATPSKVTWDAPHFEHGAPQARALDDFDVVWMRKDPPFDMDYIFTTYLLDMAGDHVLVVNDPRSLKLFNEKLWAMAFADLHPRTLLSANKDRVREFVDGLDGKAVLKPWDGNGGRGVVITDKDDRNLGSLIEILTQEGQVAVIAQEYLPGIAKGDKRVLLFDGEPVGAIMRVPGEDDHRGNMHVGASVQGVGLEERDREICARLAPHLKKWGMIFVGIDIIDGHLTEINVTSPTGIQEVNQLDGVQLEVDLVDLVEGKLSTLRSNA